MESFFRLLYHLWEKTKEMGKEEIPAFLTKNNADLAHPIGLPVHCSKNAFKPVKTAFKTSR